MLNLTSVRSQAQKADLSRARLNPGHPLAINDAYRQLKSLGWSCRNSEVHKQDHVPVFRFADPSTGSGQAASIRRDRNLPGGWIVEVDDQIFYTSTDLETITVEVQKLLTPDPQSLTPLSAAAEIAETLTAEYPEHAERIARALAIVESGNLENQYNTTYDNATYYGRYECDCPDSTHRQPRTKFGAGCKHAYALLIARLAEEQQKRVAYRKLADHIERDRARLAATAAAYEAALKPDVINRKAAHVYQVGPHRVK